MAKHQYAIDANGPKRIEVSWSGFWKNTTVKFDGNVIGTFPGQKELRQGGSFQLPDGSTINVQLIMGLYTELRVLRNGQPLPGSTSDPQTRFKAAYGIVFFIAGLNLVLGLLSLTTESNFLRSIGIGTPSIVFGLIFLGLGFVIRQQRSKMALILAIVIFGLDMILGFVLNASGGGSPSTTGIIPRIFLFIPMVQGVSAIDQLS